MHSVTLAILAVYIGLSFVLLHLGSLANQIQRVNRITNPNNTNYKSLTEFIRSGKM